MKARTIALVAGSVWVLLAALAILLQFKTTAGFPAAWGPALTLGSFMTVGTLVVSRQPRNIIGCVAGLAGVLAGLAASMPAMRLGPMAVGCRAAWRWPG